MKLTESLGKQSIPEVNHVESPTITLTDSSKENNSLNENTITPSSQSSEVKSQSTSNAFEFMMTARYKSIGTNSPGKELPNKDVKVPDREKSVKRKLMLEEWADRKGRAKKRLNDAADDECIDMKMEKRATRLRTLLKNGKKPTEIEISEEEAGPSKSSKRGLKVKLTKGKNRIEDSEDDEGHSPSNRLRSRKKRVTSSVTDENFCENLSSPLKKRDSLLGYFSKLTKTPSDNVEPNATASDTIANNVKDSSESKLRKRGRPRRTSPGKDVLDKQSITHDNRRRKTSPVDKEPDTDGSACKVISPSTSTPEPLSEGRPKRLCRDKNISYLIDENYATLRTREKKITNKEHVTPKTVKQSKPTKLAPIFAKATPKPTIDPVVLQARHEFLMSGKSNFTQNRISYFHL